MKTADALPAARPTALVGERDRRCVVAGLGLDTRGRPLAATLAAPLAATLATTIAATLAAALGNPLGAALAAAL